MSYISNSSSNTVVNGTNSADSLFSDGVNVTIYAGDGNDTIENRCYDVTIDAGAGDDYIRSDVYGHYGSQNYQSATIYAGDGNDTVYVNDHRTFIDGGAGKDSISINGGWEGHTLKGGKGDDTIYGGRSNTFLYSDGDGYDTLYNVGDGDKISIESNKKYSRANSGSDVIIKVGNGSITLKNAVGKSFSIITVAKQNQEKKTQQDVIKAFMHSLDNANISSADKMQDALDEAVKYASGGKFTSYKNLIESFVSDCKSRSTDTFLKECCSIYLNNDDTGAITGWDAGGIVTKTAESVVEEVGTLKPYKTSFRLLHSPSGLTLVWNEKDNKNVTESQKKIAQAFYSWWFSGAMDLVTESYGVDFKKTGTINEITLISVHYKDIVDIAMKDNDVVGYAKSLDYLKSTPAITWSFDNNKDGKVDSLYVYVNEEDFVKFNFSKNPNGHDNYSAYLDRIISHELTHAIMGANINYFHDLPNIIVEGMADITHGGDFRDVKDLVNSIKTLSNTTAVNLLIEDNAKGIIDYQDAAYFTGYTLLRYLAKQGSNMPNGVKCDSGKTTIALTSDFKENSFDVADYFSTVTTIDASRDTKSVKLTGNAKDNVIKASGGGGEIIGGRGKDTLYGGNGKDIFVYDSGDGNDTIENYTPGKDKIKLTSGSITSATLSGLDVILKIGSAGSITVKKAAGKKITVIDSEGKETSEVYPIKNPLPNGWKYSNTAKTSMTATLTSASKVDLTKDYGANVEKVDGSKITNSVTITGNAKANSIKGGSGKDTISGGNGNDTLYGGAGNDSLAGGSGDDKLYGNADNDKLYGGSGNDSIFGGDGSDSLFGDASNDILKGDAGSDKLYGGAGNDTIYGGADNDSLFGEAGNDKLVGDTGNDTLSGGTGNDTLTGGAGKDVFVYSGGKDVITDYTAGQDKIKIESGKISKTTYSGKNVIFTFGNGSLTVQNAKGKEITITDSSNKTQTYSKTLDLFYDNNFVTDELQLDNVSSVTETSYSVGQIHTSTNYQNIETNSIISAFALEKK